MTCEDGIKLVQICVIVGCSLKSVLSIMVQARDQGNELCTCLINCLLIISTVVLSFQNVIMFLANFTKVIQILSSIYLRCKAKRTKSKDISTQSNEFKYRRGQFYITMKTQLSNLQFKKNKSFARTGFDLIVGNPKCRFIYCFDNFHKLSSS